MLDITHYQRNANQNHHEVLYFTPVRMAVIQKSTNNKCWRGCGEKGTLLHCWWECKLVQPLWRTVWRFLKKHAFCFFFFPNLFLLLFSHYVMSDSLRPHRLYLPGSSVHGISHARILEWVVISCSRAIFSSSSLPAIRVVSSF